MLQYTVQDLINQAKSKADLENSDFIRHADNVSVLNDCWTGLYQKAIDAGEKFFIASVMLEGEGCFILPDNFFQLASVTEKNGIQIPRRSTTEIEKGLKGYEIRNNRIYIFNVHSEIKLEYYPTPATLTFPFKPVKYTLNERYYAGIKNFIYSDTACMDIDTNEITPIEGLPEGAKLYQVYKDFAVYYVPREESGYLADSDYYFVDHQTLTVDYELKDLSVIIMQDNERNVIYLDPVTGKIYNLKGIEQREIEEVPLTVSKNMVLNKDGTITVLEGWCSFWREDKPSSFFYTDNQSKICVYDADENESKKADFEQRGFLLEYNDLTGRGIWFNNTLYSSSSNVLLNYPNNLFFSVLMYDLAISYKMKQNQDTTILESKKMEIEYQYFDSLTQDDFEPVRIRNAYY